LAVAVAAAEATLRLPQQPYLAEVVVAVHRALIAYIRHPT
jgi:hypothetical protein